VPYSRRSRRSRRVPGAASRSVPARSASAMREGEGSIPLVRESAPPTVADTMSTPLILYASEFRIGTRVICRSGRHPLTLGVMRADRRMRATRPREPDQV
jgi:hypothetical protein